MSLTNTIKPRPLAKIIENRGESHSALVDKSSGNYIDTIDQKILDCKSKIDPIYYKQLPKWMNLAWDSFRIVDDNSNNVIFMLPDDPNSSVFIEFS